MTGGLLSSTIVPFAGVRGVCGVNAPVPHGVLISSGFPSSSVGEYMPKSVEEVKFRMERVRLGSRLDLGSRDEESAVSLAGVGGEGGSVDAGVISNARRGIGRRIGKLLLFIVENRVQRDQSIVGG